MAKKRKHGLLRGLYTVIGLGLFLIALMTVANLRSDLVEKWYSERFYPFLLDILTSISNRIPFSASEAIVYFFLMCFLYMIIKCVLLFFRKSYQKSGALLMRIIAFLLVQLLIFELFWGLNNYRYPIEEIMGLNTISLTADDLGDTYEWLVSSANDLRSYLNQHPQEMEIPISQILEDTQDNYIYLSKQYDFIRPRRAKVKPLGLSPLFTRAGYTGIYLYFLGEANVNTEAIKLGIPFTAAHEMAHQQGFAGEDEANFLSFLSCISNKDHPYFAYSAFLAAINYTASSLKNSDAKRYNSIMETMSDAVRSDLKKKSVFWKSHINQSVETAYNKVNDRFLKLNNQKEGISNYSHMSILLAKAYKKGLFIEAK